MSFHLCQLTSVQFRMSLLRAHSNIHTIWNLPILTVFLPQPFLPMVPVFHLGGHHSSTPAHPLLHDEGGATDLTPICHSDEEARSEKSSHLKEDFPLEQSPECHLQGRLHSGASLEPCSNQSPLANTPLFLKEPKRWSPWKMVRKRQNLQVIPQLPDGVIR